jgi:Cu(I)/Ag(I) efflux system membrane fusion protein
MTDKLSNQEQTQSSRVSSPDTQQSVSQKAETPNHPLPPSSRRETKWWLKSLFKTGLLVAAGLFLIVAVGFAQRRGWISAGGGAHLHQAGTEGNQSYVCPMMCTPNRFPEPGRCPVCGMELAEVASGGGDMEEFAIHIEPSARRVANIQTATAESTAIQRSLRTIGSISFDESRLKTISAYVDGRIEKLFADYKGVHVAKGDPMVVLYSPELYAAQVEYLLSKEASDRRGNPGQTKTFLTDLNLLESSREKLSEWGMTDAQIKELDHTGSAQSRLKILAPIGGTVIEKPVTEGRYVKEGDTLYKIADLSGVWLMLKLFPDDAAQIRYGQRVEAEVQSLPGEIFSGRVAFIDPVVNEKTRTVGVRVEILNTGRRLRPGDYASATIQVPVTPDGIVYDAELAGKWISPRHPQIIRDQPGTCPLCDIELISTSELGYEQSPEAQRKAIVIPRNAVLMAGTNSVVYVETEPGRFEIRPVTLGPLTEKTAVILHGIEAGENVATSGNFLIDSQMQLAGNPSLIDPVRAIQKMNKSSQEKKKPGPLKFDQMPLQRLAGEPGTILDEMYAAYFSIQKSLAADKTPTQRQVSDFVSTVNRLQQAEEFSDQLHSFLTPISEDFEQLHTSDLEISREKFKPISHAVVRLASKVRGSKGGKPFVHFYCPMVEGGGGDWLQATGPLANPYFGSQMLRCGKKVHEFAIGGGSLDHEPALQAPKSSDVEKTAILPAPTLLR